MPNPLEIAGSRSTKKTRFAPIFINRPYGLYTNRNPLRDPSDTAFEKFYGGRPGALIGGQNVELTNKLTLARRAGVSQFSAVTYPDVPDTFYSFRKQDGTIKVIVDTTGFVFADNQDGTKTTILTKSAGASQSYFQGVGNTLYFGNGVDLKKWDGTNTWNWGSAAPLAAPGVTITPSGSSSVLWQGNTVYSTIGLIVDSNGNVQQMVSVNATGTNTTRYGTTGNGQPNWNAALGGTTTDNTVTWTNRSPVGLWTPNTLYNNASANTGTLANPCFIYDPATDAVYANINPGGAAGTGTSSATRPAFTGVNGSIVYETNNAVKWFCIQPKPGLWQASHVYAGFGQPGLVNASVVEPIPLSATYNPAVQPTFLQVASTGGTSGAGGTSPVWGTTVGAQSQDGDLVWVCQGSATWTALTSYTGWGGSGQLLFSVIKDQNGNFQVSVQAGSGVSGNTVPMAQWKATTAYTVNAVVIDSNGYQQKVTSVSGTGTSGAAAPAWNSTVGGTTTDNAGANQIVWTNQGIAGVGGRPPGWGINYGDQTNDGTAKWACVGPTMQWAASTIWYFPITNFSPPQPSSPYGGPDIKDANSNVQFVIASGKSQTPGPPTWGSTVGAKTTDGAATWYCASTFSANSLSWTKGYGYVTAFKARPANDVYNTVTPPGMRAPLGPPTGSQSGLVTTASLPFIMATGVNSGSVNTISGVGSTDPQIDTVVIFRSTDGFQNGGPYLFLTEIPNPPVLNGAAGAWSYKDYQPDTALNPLFVAPINGANNPPPAGAINAVLHFGHIWVSVGSVVYASGGPDTTTGNGSEAFPAINSFVFPSNVTRLLPTSVGLIVFTTSDIYGIFGGPSILTFYPQPLVPGVGLLSWNALDQEGGLIYLFSADGQFLALDPSLGVTRSGFPIADQIANWNPSNVYVTCHEAGNDNAIYLADGSTGWYRVNPTQAPDGGAVWSPKANITGGCKVVQSIEVTKGVHQLLIGSTTGGQTISKRDLTVFADKGAAYQADFTIGSLVLAHPGQLAELNFITSDFTRVGTSPGISFLLNEISGPFTAFGTPIPDPPSLYGTTGQPLTLFANRYYFSATQASAWCRHLQIKVNFGATDTVMNEMLALTLFAAHYQEL